MNAVEAIESQGIKVVSNPVILTNGVRSHRPAESDSLGIRELGSIPYLSHNSVPELLSQMDDYDLFDQIIVNRPVEGGGF